MTENKNPFLKPYNTPHDTAPFHLIKGARFRSLKYKMEVIPISIAIAAAEE